MTTTNIWGGIKFSDYTSKSVYEYLNGQNQYLEESTQSELKMEVEAVNGYLDDPLQTFVKLNKLFIVAPKLGGFRRKILTVVEGKYGSRFPVDIYCHIDETSTVEVLEIDFLNKISEILSRERVQLTIVDLYRQSKEQN